NVGEGLADLPGVLPCELDDLGRVPDDVVLAHGLKPEGRDADRALPHLRVPDEEPGGEGLATDLAPAGRVHEEAEHVLLAGVEPCPAVYANRRRLEIDRELLEHRDHLGVVEPGVARAVEASKPPLFGEELNWLCGSRNRLAKNAGRGV